MVLLGTCLGYGLFILYVVCSYANVPVLHNRYVNKKVAGTLYVPKWDLYTASPQVRVSELYRVEGGKMVPVDMRPFTPEYLFGLNRKFKVLAQEVSVISNDKTLAATMKECIVQVPAKADIQQFVDPDTLIYNDVVRQEITLLKGRYVIVMHEPSDWEAARRNDGSTLPMHIVAINIKAQ